MSRKIARITQDGSLYTNQLHEGNKLSINPNFVEIGGELIEGYPFVKPAIDDSLVLWLDGTTGNNYDKTGTWKDLSGNGNDGQLMNFNYDEGSGWVDGGLKFDGVDDYVEIPYLGLTKNMSVSIGIFISIIPEGKQILMSNTDFAIGFIHGNSLIMTTKSHKRKATIDGLVTNSWNNITVAYDENSTPSCFINGIETSYSGTDHWLNPGNFIGKRETGNHYKGIITSVHIYNRALTNEEIMQNYKAGQCSPLLAMRGDAIG